MGEPTARPRGVRVRTACTSEAEFITAFQEVVDESTVFAPTDRLKPVKAPCAFSLELADGTPMLRGLGLITDAWATGEASPFGRPGMKIEIDQLTTTSEVIFEKLLNARAALVAANKPRQRPNPQTHQLWGGESAPPTEEMPVPNPDIDEADAAELPRTITRELFAVAPPPDADESQTQRAAARYSEPRPAPPRPPTPRPLPRRDSKPVVAPRDSAAPIAPFAPAPSAAIAMAPPTTIPPPTAGPIESGFDLSEALAAARPRPWWMNGRIAGVFGAGLALGLLVSLAFRGGGTERAPAPVAAQAAPAAVAPPPPVAMNCPPVPAAPTEVAALEPAPETPAPPAPAPRPAAVAKAPPPAPRPASRPAPTAVAKAAPAPAVPATKPTRPAPVTVAKTAPVTARPATTTKTSKPAVAATRRPKKAACSSLDCI